MSEQNHQVICKNLRLLYRGLEGLISYLYVANRETSDISLDRLIKLSVYLKELVRDVLKDLGCEE